MEHDFKTSLEKYFSDFFKSVSTDKGDWTVKGFIDIYKNIYTISLDTKVVSKIIELMIFPIIVKFAYENDYDFELSNHQNHYPDLTFISKKTKEKIAVDLKSTYRIDSKKVNGMTLGAFTGYFRNRKSNKNVKYPYDTYSKHYILGVIYTKVDLYNAEIIFKELGVELNQKQNEALSKYISNSTDENFEALINNIEKREINKNSNKIKVDDKVLDKKSLRAKLNLCIISEKEILPIEKLNDITSVVRDFDFFIQEKWKIALDRPGSGNTKNIGSTNKIEELLNGTGIFTKYSKGKKLFDQFWMNYLTLDMAKGIEMDKPNYMNLKSYLEYKQSLK